MQPTQKQTGLGRLSYIWTEWISTFVILVLLLLTLVIGTGEMIHGQLLRMGERLYGDPASGMQYSFLRAEPEKPTCERHPDMDAQVQKQMQANAADEFADIFGTASEADVRASILAGQQLCEEKYQFHDRAVTYIDDHSTLRTYRAVETSFFGVFQFGTENRALILVIMVVFAAISATLKTHHIGLRSPATRIDYKVYSVFMLAANLLLTSSALSQYHSMMNAGVEIGREIQIIYGLWITLFGILSLISLFYLFKPPKPSREGGSFGLAFLSVPLYAYMAVITGVAFTFFMDYPMGQGIYLGQLVEFSSIFLNLALFIWAGMLLKQTQIVDMFLNILRPWNLAPETLTWLILLAAALPTAYTGASGIFVIAAGAIIYKEVWLSGGRRQFALAASAMSGSLGVVLRPCLLIVVVASLNKEVTTDLLYHYGLYVFLLTSTLFLVISLFFAERKFRIAAPSVAFPKSFRAIGPVLPYVLIFVLIWLFYKYILATDLNEFTAPVMMPVILLMIVLFDKLRQSPEAVTTVGYNPAVDRYAVTMGDPATLATVNTAIPATEYHQVVTANATQGMSADHSVARSGPVKEPQVGFKRALHLSTSETVGHIGALVILMALSVSVGGFLERIEIMSAFPTDISNTFLVLTMIVAVMVFVGMIMDPFGAVILISATIAPVAYQYGIHPVHFWMIALIGFELGYVTPPVALNHLLARQSIGDEEVADADAEVRHKSFYYRYERWILPVIVMFPAMLIITFAPYIFKLFGWYQ
ncbi:TRAP transporter large permease subunit [Acinetobacter radioresistens]|uniref:TRAP transporter large permease subunit n=1 Tax=Acinetobacter radioresistens TaxID=40216 RepID=UPI0021CD62F4|nr:TRAP transporter large permease subunit [Acinetobacter radioresistens]MCU4307766.1 TRAP transporter large permease subunit [Acinetobacter radioresistens]MCU4566862.1 TRAP transporter large permease subunit [Acinetobacter radioresistens]